MHYDAAGNLDIDTYSAAAFSRVYDAENRMTQEKRTTTEVTGTYSYDGDGHRVKRVIGSTETWQVYGVGGELIAEYAANTAAYNPQKEYGYRNGQLLITADAPVTGSGGWGAPPAFTGPDPLSKGDDIKLENLTELRTAVNSLRAHAGLPAYNFTVDSSPVRDETIVKADHIRQLREALEGARTALGLSNGGYAHPTLTENSSLIYAIDFQELRTQIRSAWNNGEVKLPLVGAVSSRDHSAGYDASHAINGNLNDLWSAGDYAPQWIQVDLGQARTISRVRLLVDQSPSGHTTHQVYGGPTTDSLSLLGTFDGDTVFHQWLELSASASNIRYIKVSTTVSPSWVGWAEIEVYGPAGTTSSVHWLVADQLGTPRMIFDQTGSLTVNDLNGNYVSGMTRHDYLPFGEELGAGTGGRTTAQGYSASDGIRQHFTQKERDNETGLDYFLARYYSSTQGRFTSPDEFMNDTHVADPASWNLYTYVRNNPLRLIDPTGEVVNGDGLSADERQQLIDDWKKKTGYNNVYFDKKNNLVIDHDSGIAKDANGKFLGSADARANLTDAIETKDVFNLEHANGSSKVAFADNELTQVTTNAQTHETFRTYRVRIDFSDFKQQSGDREAIEANSIGLVTLHEIDHNLYGHIEDYPSGPNNPGAVENNYINPIREQLGLAQRATYDAKPVSGALSSVYRGYVQVRYTLNGKDKMLRWQDMVVGGVHK